MVHEFLITPVQADKLLIGFRCHPYGKAEVIEGTRMKILLQCSAGNSRPKRVTSFHQGLAENYGSKCMKILHQGSAENFG